MHKDHHHMYKFERSHLRSDQKYDDSKKRHFHDTKIAHASILFTMECRGEFKKHEIKSETELLWKIPFDVANYNVMGLSGITNTRVRQHQYTITMQKASPEK